VPHTPAHGGRAIDTPPGRTTAIAGALVAVLLVAGPALAQPAPATPSPRGDRVAAEVGDEVIRLEDVEGPLRASLAQLEQQRYELLQQKLDQLIAERLLAQEARGRAMSVEQLLKEEVHAKVPPVTDDQVTAFMTENRARLPRGDERELRLRVWDYLRAQQVGERRQRYVDELRTRTRVAVHLEEPESARVPVSAGTGHVRGPQDARVVIVEFSDFQCPFCKTVVPTVKQVLERYPGQVKWVFRDFPIPGLHPEAARAHEAARCAGDQGKFWEYHDVLFERSPRHAPAQLKAYATELGLDGAAFGRCLDTGQHQQAVAADMEEGARLGVTGTPTFFVNGRMLVGAQPAPAFHRLIDSELRRPPTP
jgi:protein-disulfide isomerase